MEFAPNEKFIDLGMFIQGIPQEILKSSKQVSIYWDDDRQRWIYCEAWPKDFTSGEYFLYDVEMEEWRKKKLW